MEREKMKDISNIDIVASLFTEYSMRYPREVDLLAEKGKLSQKYGDWSNVLEHSLVQVLEMTILAKLLDLSEEETHTLEQVALIHDWEKRLEKSSTDFTPEDIEEAKSLFKEINPDVSVLESTSTGFSKEILGDRATLLQKIMFYIDDITKGRDIVNAMERIDEVEFRRQDLNESTEWTEKLGGKYWDVERQALKKVEAEIFELLKSKGVNIEKPEDLPKLIIQKIEEFKLKYA